MNIFEQIRANIQKAMNDLPKIVVDAMVANESAIIDINTEQLAQGIGSDGVQLGEYASPEYAQMKQALGSKAPYAWVDLKLEGSFYEGFYVEPFFGGNDTAGLYIDSRDEKTESLERKYSDVFGIAPDNVPEVQELIADDIIKTLTDALTEN